MSLLKQARILREAARAAGQKRYITVKPCKHGHTDRIVSDNKCWPCRYNYEKTIKRRAPAYKEKRRRNRATYEARYPEKTRVKRRLQAQRRYKKYPHLYRLKEAQRRAAERRAMPTWLTNDDRALIKTIYALAVSMTRTTGVMFHVDHIIPLRGETVCGLHVPSNLQILLAQENFVKSNQYD